MTLGWVRDGEFIEVAAHDESARAADPMLHAPFASTPEEDERVASMMAGVASEVVDYLLFIDETPLSGQITGSSGFAERFSARGPRDRKGRSLYQLDLNRRLMKYPFDN